MTARVRALLVVLSILSCPALAKTAAADLAGAHEVAKRIGMSEASIERVRAGEIVVEELEASSDKDLSLAIVAAIEASLAKILELSDLKKFAEVSTVTISEGAIDTNTFSLDGLTLDDEVLEQLADDPAGLFQMSEDEARRVQEGAASGKAGALAAYRAVLSARAKAYWEGGAAAITPYAGKNRAPKDDLASANEAARKIIMTPAIREMLDEIPSQAKGPAVHGLRWAVQKGRDQAAPVLTHRIQYRADEGTVVVDRRFYSAYDYDSLQIVIGVLPVSETRSVIFYTNHTYTAQVAGFGGGAKRSIGRKLMQKELVAEIERMRQIAKPG